MTITITNAKVVSDESSDLQNATATAGVAGDSDDNDIALTALSFPSIFSIFSGYGTISNAALSGYTGAAGNTGADAFTVSPSGGGAITDVSFVGLDGKPLNGLDSGLLTVNGTKIYLYTDLANNNIVLGRVGNDGDTPGIPGDDSANPSGTVAFAGYIEQTMTGTAITGGKIWLVQYQTLLNPPINGINGPDDPVDLDGKVYIGVSEDTDFSLAGAPSGQNLFLMFTKATPTVVDGRITDVSIVATGKDPLNQSNGGNISSGDTINTSQAGGPTTFGTNSQMITEQEGIRYSFVTGARQEFTIPNLDQNEADVESNIDFTAFFGTHSAHFDVVQLQSGKSAQVRITAYSSNFANVAGDSDSSHANESGAGFIDGYADDAVVAISKVTVTNTATGATIASATGSVTLNGIGFTFANGVVLVTGIKAGYTIDYTTTTDHNRVLIENGAATNATGNTHADFDIGGFKVVQTSVGQEEIGSHMVFEDDGPNIALLEQGGAGDATVDESSLGGAGATDSFEGSTFFNQVANATGPGADGSGATITQLYALKLATPLPSSGIVDTATGLTVLLKIDATNTVVTGYVVVGGTDTPVFTIGLDSALGTVTLTEMRAVVHANTNNPNDQEKFDGSQILLTRTDTITDKDGDSAIDTKIADITAQFVFLDDGPSAGANDDVQFDDDALANGILGGTGDVSPDTANTTGTLSKGYGADGAGSVSLLTTAVLPNGFTYDPTSTSTNLMIQQGGSTVLTVTLTDAVTGAYSVTQNAAISHPAAGAENDLSFTFNYRVTDKDGDHADSTLVVNIDDDTPTATGTPVTGTVDEDGLTNGLAGGMGDVAGEATTASGSVAGVFQSGADTPLSYGLSSDTTALQALSSGGTALVYSVSGNTLTARAGVGGANVFTFAITDTATGAYTFTLLKPLDHAAGNAENDENDITINLGTAVQATDKDGDTVTATAEKVAILVDDDTPTLAFGNLVGTGTSLPQFGFWSKAAGADGPNAADLQIALTGFQLGGVAQAAANFSLTEGSSSPDGSGNYNYNWTGSLSGDFDNNGAVDANPLTFTLTALTNGRYAVDLAAPVQSSTTTDTASGGLGAGGPDPVQTLLIPPAPAIPTETVVFFSAKFDAPEGSIPNGIILGQPDPTEFALQGNDNDPPYPNLASFIDPRNMNVSTAGIGVDNNNLNGYGASGANALIDDPDGAGNTPADDSFVVNPLTLVDKVRVFIDNSVTGYDYVGGERLQYRTFYADGTVSAYQTLIGNIGKAPAPSGAQGFFEIDGGGKKIDAVQLTMLYGEIKIPNIQFVTLTESLAKDISLDFTASLTDKDGDTVSSDFSADLFTNKAASATFDYELIGTALAADSFDVDLASTRNDYQITGFDTAGARDKIVLIGAAAASVTNIDNAGEDSIVTITETVGGEITTLTVVGVDLLNTDFLIVGP